MIAQLSALVLAIDPKNWTESPIGKWISGLLAVMGGIIVVIAIIKAIAAFISGKLPQGLKIIAGAAILATFMFKPALITDVVVFLSDIVKTVLNTGSDINQQTGANN